MKKMSIYMQMLIIIFLVLLRLMTQQGWLLMICDYMNSKIKPNKSCKKFHARKLSFFVVAFSKMILAMGCKAAKRLYSLASHSQNR